jgi:hypothetical protein
MQELFLRIFRLPSQQLQRPHVGIVLLRAGMQDVLSKAALTQAERHLLQG